MRPYLAILKDAFREALASRILWLLFGLITLLLVAFACLSVVRHGDWEFTRWDLRDPATFLKTLTQAGEPDAPPSPARQVWRTMDPEHQDRLRAWDTATTNGPPQERLRQARERLVEALNSILPKPGLYDSAAWAAVEIPFDIEAQLPAAAAEPGEQAPTPNPADSPPLVASDPAATPTAEDSAALPPQLDQEGLNRRLLEAAFPGWIEASQGNAYFVKMLHWEFPQPIASSRGQMELRVNRALFAVITFFLGVAGVFVAILVTASIVPRTFEAGSIDLLLSKPITRASLFLTKYVGGCSFILLSAGYFLVGLWLIAGLRADVWNARLLHCVYVFLFLFGIYYSVSCLVGVIWRNAIVCIAAVVVFWFACWAVGMARGILHDIWLDPLRIDTLHAAGEMYWGTAKNGSVQLWDQHERQWKEILAQPNQPGFGNLRMTGSLVGPIYDSDHNRMIAVPGGITFNGSNVVWGTAANDYQRQEGSEAPPGASAMFPTATGDILVVCQQGVYRLADDPTQPPRDREPLTIMGREIPLPIRFPNQQTPFVDIGPKSRLPLARGYDVDYDRGTGRLAFVSNDKLFVLERTAEGAYQLAAETEIEELGGEAIAIRGDRLVVATDRGAVHWLDATTLQTIHTVDVDSDTDPQRIVASPDGRWAAVEWQDQRITLFDNDQHTQLDTLSGQGKLTSATFLEDGSLAVVDQRGRVTRYRLDTWQNERVVTPAASTLENVYYYIIQPVYTVFPKPGELDSLTMYLVTGERDFETGPPGASRTVVLDVWTPIWSCLAFTAVTLLLGAVYVWRTDF